jgi:nitroreductase
MDFFELMKKRTSSRKYTEEAVTSEELERILKAGMYAPVGSNRYKDLHLTVVRDRRILHRLAKAGILFMVPGNINFTLCYLAPTCWSAR